MAEISGGVYSLPRTFDLDQLVRPADDLVGDDLLFGGHLVVPPAHEPLDREDGVLGVGDLLVLGDLADQPLALVREADDRGGQPPAGCIDQHLGRRALHDGHDGLRRAQVYSDDFAHLKRPFLAVVLASDDCLLSFAFRQSRIDTSLGKSNAKPVPAPGYATHNA